MRGSPHNNNRLLSLSWSFYDNIKQLERQLGVEINWRDNIFKPLSVDAAASVLTSLYVDTAPLRGIIANIKPEYIHLAIKQSRVLKQTADSVPDYGRVLNIPTKRGIIKSSTLNQA